MYVHIKLHNIEKHEIIIITFFLYNNNTYNIKISIMFTKKKDKKEREQKREIGNSK